MRPCRARPAISAQASARQRQTSTWAPRSGTLETAPTSAAEAESSVIAQQRASVENLVLENQVVDWVLEQAKVEEDQTSFKEVTEKQG